jgi:hypothetical protein
MPVPGFERHGVYHIATRGGHETSVVIIDDDTDYVEGFRCDVRDIRQNDDPSPRAPVESHNAHVVVADEPVTFTDDVVDLSVYVGRLTDDRAFERVDFPDVEEDHSTRYANLAAAFDYEPDVGEREDGARSSDDVPHFVVVDTDDGDTGLLYAADTHDEAEGVREEYESGDRTFPDASIEDTLRVVAQDDVEGDSDE